MMTPREKLVMDLYDEGLTIGRIALRLGLKRGAVATITKKYSLGDGGFEAGIVKGTELLRRAIQREHPGMVQEFRV
jgi:DNA-binding NarL/FixJ family response regulator